MIHYLFDASAAADFYAPQSSFSPGEYLRYRRLKKHITTQKLQRKAILFLPSFCVAEVKRTLGKWRQEGVFPSKESHRSAEGNFVGHIHDRQFFYCCDLNRYHNLNATEVIEQEISMPLTKGNHLSGLDVLVIAMGMELKVILGRQVHLLSGDRRMIDVCETKPDVFPKPYYWRRIDDKDLPGR